MLNNAAPLGANSCCSSRVKLSRIYFVPHSTMVEQLVKFFVVFLFVVEPVSLIPLFNGLTDGASPAYKHRMAVKAVTISGLIILPFAFGGAEFLRLLGNQPCRLPDIRRSPPLFDRTRHGLRARVGHTHLEHRARGESAAGGRVGIPARVSLYCRPGGACDDSVVVRPGAPAVASRCMFLGLLVAATLVLAITLAMMWLADPLQRVLGVTGANVANRLVGRDSGRARGAVRHRRPAQQFLIPESLGPFSCSGRRDPTPHARGARRAARSASGALAPGRGMKAHPAATFCRRGSASSTSSICSA